MKRIIKACMGIATVFAACTSVSAQEGPKETFKDRADRFYKDLNAVRDMVYKTADGEELSMDLILPEKQILSEGTPVVMYIHGGGWHGGERYVLHPNVLKRYTDKGIAVACISYRLVKGERTVLQCIEDCKDAARFLVKNASKYKLDPKRFAATGHSAGAHLSLLAALSPNSVFGGDPSLKSYVPTFVCVAAYAPVTSFYDPAASSPTALTSDERTMARLLGGEPPEKQELAKKLSPMEYLMKNSPKVLLVHGDMDSLISVNGSRLMAQKGDKIGASVEFIEVKNADHSFKGNDLSPGSLFIDERRFDFIIDALINAVGNAR